MNTTGQLFRVTTWGESHGTALGVVIDGCPANLALQEKDIQHDLNRRKPGQSTITTTRKEKDTVEILSGVYKGKTTGAPISLIVYNKDQRSKDYAKIKKAYRPSHSDFTYHKKYGNYDPRGGGRASARITLGRVAAGAIAKKILKKIAIVAYVQRVMDVEALVDQRKVTQKQVEKNIVRCPDTDAAIEMIALITDAKKNGDSLGGVIECVVRNLPAGLGEPEFDKLDADLAKICMSIPATKGFEIGSGFQGTYLYGSEHNDPFTMKGKKVVTTTNNSGGVQGGISNGMPLVLRLGFKPTSTIMQQQRTVSKSKKNVKLKATGRHDPCVIPRAVPIVEASVALVLCDHFLRWQAR